MSEPPDNTSQMPKEETRDGNTVLDLGGLSGLSEENAHARLKDEGPNELPTQKKRSLLTIVLEVAREPMFLMLVAAGSLYLLMGEPADALMLLGFVFVVMAITIIQERRTERALEALRDLSSPRALVIRGGVHRRIPGRDVVRGDIVVLCEGDRVPADGLLRRGINLSTDESLLTGESVPVRKVASAQARQLDKPGGDDLPSVFSGTLVTAGQGIAEIAATGLDSELGKISKALERVEPEPTLLQEETRRLVRTFAIAGLSMIPVFFADWPLLLLPVHIVFLELIIDPACSLIFEAEYAEANVMQRPPRNPDERLFSMRTIGVAVMQGISVLAVCLGVFLIARLDHSADVARALTFATLVMAFIAIILVNRSWTRSAFAMLRAPNAALKWVVLGACTFPAVVLAVPFAQRLFYFAPIHPTDLILSLGAGLVCVLWFELVKLARRHQRI